MLPCWGTCLGKAARVKHLQLSSAVFKNPASRLCRCWCSFLVSEGHCCLLSATVCCGFMLPSRMPFGEEREGGELCIPITALPPSLWSAGGANWESHCFAFQVFKGNWFLAVFRDGLLLHIWSVLGDVSMHFIYFCTKWRLVNADTIMTPEWLDWIFTEHKTMGRKIQVFLLMFSEVCLFASFSLSWLFIAGLSLTWFWRSLAMLLTDFFNFVEADIVVKPE